MRNISLDIAEPENQEDTGNDNEGQVTDENVTSVADVMMRGTSAYSYSLQAYRGTSKFTTHQVENSLGLRLFQKSFSKKAVKIARSPALMVMALLFCYLPLIGWTIIIFL